MDLKGQTFTLEGVAASLLILLAVYTMFQSTVVIAPSWSDFANVQLKQIGYDILKILDNPNGGNSSLAGMIENCSSGYKAPEEFNTNLSKILENLNTFGRVDLIWTNGSKIEQITLNGFNRTPTPDAVRVSRFVVVPNLHNSECFGLTTPETKVVEVRLTLWRT
ncbi:MAG: hypothetical protein H0Z19_01990 [Archaeoglobus sp.]|uniref:DUF7288 family protein n=1 Tax=Archaeoglobus sp. TaxID=1872626 RepID=UPI001E176539|nr:hypothetical protein [Archaeoglobus sp.]MBO8179244.1 hypothetical protein [Archaeoglobus sp.]